VPFFVEVVIPERTNIGVCLVIILAVDTLKCMGVWFALLGFKTREVDFKVCLATPCKMSMMFNFMWFIALYVPKTLEAANKSGIIPLSAVLALQNIRIHICPTNSGNKATDVETIINEWLGH